MGEMSKRNSKSGRRRKKRSAKMKGSNRHHLQVEHETSYPLVPRGKVVVVEVSSRTTSKTLTLMTHLKLPRRTGTSLQ